MEIKADREGVRGRTERKRRRQARETVRFGERS